MPKTTKKTTIRKPSRSSSKKGKTRSEMQSEALKVDLSLVIKLEEWARRHNLSFNAAIEKAFNDLVEKGKPKEDAFLKMLEAAPEDDEPFTDEERASEEEGWRECQQGLSRPWSEVRKELAGGK